MLEPCWKPRRLEIGKKAIWSRFCKAFKMEADLETIWGRFSRRLEQQKRAKVWEGLQNSNVGLSQHNIDLGSVWDRILGGFGVQFGTVLGFMTEKKKKTFKSGPKRKSK